MHYVARPRKKRLVNFQHNIRYFKPTGIQLDLLDEINITIDELETLRLNYIEKLNQNDAAFRMRIHQSTFQRTLRRTLEKITDALINGKAIRVQGGYYTLPGRDGTGPTGQGPIGQGAPGRGSRGGRPGRPAVHLSFWTILHAGRRIIDNRQ